MTSKFFKEGFSHWFFQRLSAFTIILLFSSVFLISSVWLTFLLLLVILLHGTLGIDTLIDDYVHKSVYKQLCFFTSRVILIFIFKLSFLIFLT